MNIINEDVISKILTGIFKDKITTLNWSLDNSVTKAGNNYLSEVSKLTINYIKDGKQYKKKFFLKIPINTPVYEYGIHYQLFQKERKMYAEVLPQLHKIGDDEYFTPKIYYSDEKYTLALQDLSYSGYVIADRIQQLDFEHCVCALKRLAIFHGLSVKLEEKNGMEDIIKIDYFFTSDRNGENFKNAVLMGLNIILENIPPELKMKYTEKIESLKNITWKDLRTSASAKENSFNVLNHGDYWTSNILFKYDKFGSIKETKIIDFQLSKWASPVIDLIFFTISSMKFEVFEKYFDLLLQIYLNTLNKVLSKFNCKVYEMEQLKLEINNRYLYFISVIFFPLPVILLSRQNASCTKNMVRGLEFTPCSLEKAYYDEYYLGIAKKWFLYYLENETISKVV